MTIGDRNHRHFWTAAYREDVECIGPQPEADPVLTRAEYRDASETGRALYDSLKEMRDEQNNPD